MDQVYRLMERAHQGDKEAREQLILDNRALVWSVVRRFEGRGAEREELFQIGMVGLMKSIDHFDTSFQVCFSTYAVPVIVGELRRFLRDDGPMKVSRSIMDNCRLLQQTMEECSRQLQEGERTREPDLQELSSLTGLSVESIVLAQGAAHPVTSIYQPAYQEKDTQILLIDQLPAGGKPVAEETVERTVLGQALEQLGERERQLIEYRYFQSMTQSKAAERMGMTQVQVSRMEKKALLKMRAFMDGG